MQSIMTTSMKPSWWNMTFATPFLMWQIGKGMAALLVLLQPQYVVPLHIWKAMKQHLLPCGHIFFTLCVTCKPSTSTTSWALLTFIEMSYWDSFVNVSAWFIFPHMRWCLSPIRSITTCICTLVNCMATRLSNWIKALLMQQCYKVLQWIVGIVLWEHFAQFIAMHMDGSYLMYVHWMKPLFIWVQVDDNEMSELAKVFVHVHGNLVGVVDDIRNHKTNNWVRLKQCLRLGQGKCEKHVVIAFNST